MNARNYEIKHSLKIKKNYFPCVRLLRFGYVDHNVSSKLSDNCESTKTKLSRRKNDVIFLLRALYSRFATKIKN